MYADPLALSCSLSAAPCQETAPLHQVPGKPELPAPLAHSDAAPKR